MSVPDGLDEGEGEPPLSSAEGRPELVGEGRFHFILVWLEAKAVDEVEGVKTLGGLNRPDNAEGSRQLRALPMEGEVVKNGPHGNASS